VSRAADRRDRGSATIELVILTPAALAFVLLVVIAGRMVLAQQTLDSAAYDAARTASLSQSAMSADTNGRRAADLALADQGLRCQNRITHIDTSGFAVPVGNTATVRVEITCDVLFTDMLLPGVTVWNSGLRTTVPIRSTFVSPLDTYRRRS
jgi:Flp pilus assembly protein TadG